MIMWKKYTKAEMNKPLHICYQNVDWLPDRYLKNWQSGCSIHLKGKKICIYRKKQCIYRVWYYQLVSDIHWRFWNISPSRKGVTTVWFLDTSGRIALYFLQVLVFISQNVSTKYQIVIQRNTTYTEPQDRK